MKSENGVAFQAFHLFIFITWKKDKLIFWSSDSDIKKMISNASPESSKKSTKFAVKESFKIWEEGYN